MARPSKIDRMDPAIREKIGQLRAEGRTIDEIMDKLRELNVTDISRSGLGRHIQEIDVIAEQIKRGRAISESVMERLGEGKESRVARMNIELLHGALTRFFIAPEGEDVRLSAKEAQSLSDAIYRLTKASGANADFMAKVEARLKAEMAKQLDGALKDAQAAGEPGLSAERIAQLRREFLGVPGKPAP